MNNLYLRILEEIQDDLFEEGVATTMDAVSYLPSQVGVVQAAMKKLRGKKNFWDLEILEADEEYTVTFEDQLKISVPKEHWESFQGVFEGGLDNNSYLNLQVKLMESVEELNGEDLLENRKEELRLKIEEEIHCPVIQTAAKVANKFFNSFNCQQDMLESIKAAVSLIGIEEHLEKHIEDLLEDYEDDLGFIEILIENIKPMFPVSVGDRLAGARFKSVYEGVELIFEAKVTFEKDCSFSIAIHDDEAADRLEEYCVGLSRIGNVFYPTTGQILSGNGVLESIKEVIVDMQEDNEEENEGEEDE